MLRLLNQSAEARSLLRQLQHHSQLLKQLPTKTLPADFSDTIVDTLKKTATTPALPQDAKPTPIRPGPRIAIHLAWAAGLLLAIGTGLFFFLRGPQEPPPIAQHDDEPPPIILNNKSPVLPNESQKAVSKDPAAPFDGRLTFAELRHQPQQTFVEAELKKARTFRIDVLR